MKKKFIIVIMVMFSMFILIPTKVKASFSCWNWHQPYSKEANISCGGVTSNVQIYEVGSNRESENDKSNYGGIFGNDACYIRNKQLAANQNNLNEVYYYARANTGHDITDVQAIVYSSNGEVCKTYMIVDNLNGYSSVNIKFSNSTFNDSKARIMLKANTFDTKNNVTGNPFYLEFNQSTIDSITNATSKKEVENAFNENALGNTKENDKNDSQSEIIPDVLKVSSDTNVGEAANVRNIKCDSDIKDMIHKYWKWVMFIIPLLLIVMIMIDFLKAMAVGDADAIKKSSSNAIKRVIAAIVLIALPWALSVIFGWFGLEICF